MNDALAVQIQGSHYKGMKIQPVEFIHANSIPFIEGCVIKYLCRWRSKGGVKDLEKAKHFIDLLIQLEGASAPNLTELKGDTHGTKEDERSGYDTRSDRDDQLSGDDDSRGVRRTGRKEHCGSISGRTGIRPLGVKRGECGDSFSGAIPDSDGESRPDYIIFDSQNHTTL